VSLRSRLTLAAGGAVFVALAAASLVVYFSVRSNLHDQIDVGLITSAQNVAAKTAVQPIPVAKGATVPKAALDKAKQQDAQAATGPFLGTDGSGYLQYIPNIGTLLKQGIRQPNGFVPLEKADVAVAGGYAPAYFSDVKIHGVPMRLYTMRSQNGLGLIRTARPLSDVNATLTHVRWLLIGLTLAGALVAALFGRLAAAAVLKPVGALARTVREVTLTRELDRRIEVESRDEVGSLAADFNAMLEALEESQRAQQQLIADASHELRTPLAAHRANVELLARDDLPGSRRPHVFDAAVRGIEELAALVDDLITAARNGKPVDAREPVALDELVARAVERVGQRAPGLRFETSLEPTAVSGSRARLERAVDNVLDNAVKWSPPDGVVQVELRDGTLRVRDHGPGIEEADLPHVFDRFYRAADARALPGSGLGLAIVKQTVDDHGGEVEIANADDGGAVVSIALSKL